MKNKNSLFFLFLIINLFLTFYFQANAQSDSIKIIKVGVDQKYYPFEFKENNEIKGFNIDLLNEISKKTNIKFVFIADEWNKIIQLIENDSIDLLSGMFYSEERLKKYYFSIPHSIVSYSVFLNNKAPSNDINQLKILSQEADIASEYLKGNNFRFETVNSPVDALLKIENDSKYCAVISTIVGLNEIKRKNLINIKVLEKSLISKKYCFATKNINNDLIFQINEAITVLKENGTYNKISDKWFGDIESKQNDTFLNYLLFTFAGILILSLILLIWNRLLAKQVKKKTKDLRNQLKIIKEAEQKLSDSEEKYRNFIAYSSDGIAFYNSDGIVLKWNKAMENITSYTIEEVANKYIWDIQFELKKNKLDNAQKSEKVEIIKNGLINRTLQKSFQEEEIITKDGFSKTIQVEIFPIQLNNGFMIGSIARDVTKIKEYQTNIDNLNNDLKLKNKELESIIYVTSHDLRTPLINIQGFTKEIEKHISYLSDYFNKPEKIVSEKTQIIKLKNEINDSFRYIFTSVDKIEQLLNGLLKISRLGKVEIVKKQINLVVLFTEIFKNFEYSLKKNNITTEMINVKECSGDESLLNQVFSNLIENAIKYVDYSKVKRTITIKAEKTETYTTITIEDNGLGIDKSQQNLIFEIFYKAGPKSGEGLGLSIVKKIIEKHNGKLWIESDKNIFTKFYIQLPN